MTHLANRKTALAALLVTASALAVLIARGRPIAAAPAHAVARPTLATPSNAKACWVEYGRNETLGQVGTAGITHAAKWDITVSGLLVRHPKGDLVIDVGNSSAFTAEIADYPVLERTWLTLLPGSNRVVATAPQALRAAGVNPDQLTVVPTHAHVDHLGGLVDLPGARVLMPQEEIDFAGGHGDDHYLHVVPAHARTLRGRTTPIAFEARPYETFDESADLLGDGTVVAVKLFGHTPGSIGVFVNVSPNHRFFHVGDAVNVLEAVERRLTKSIVMAGTDHERAAADAAVAQIARLHEAEPEIAVLPAHDRDAWKRAFGEPGACVN